MLIVMLNKPQLLCLLITRNKRRSWSVSVFSFINTSFVFFISIRRWHDKDWTNDRAKLNSIQTLPSQSKIRKVGTKSNSFDIFRSNRLLQVTFILHVYMYACSKFYAEVHQEHAKIIGSCILACILNFHYMWKFLATAKT